MSQVAAFSILAITVTLSLRRPVVWRWRIGHALAAVLGAATCVLFDLVPLPLVRQTLLFLSVPLITIASLMVITLVAEELGLFDWLATNLARMADGNARRLFAYIFFAGTVTGAVFTNDAAVLIFTPVVFKLIERVQQDDWGVVQKIPFYFAVLYVANVVGILVISNPINIIVAEFFDISFHEYAKWMLLPALTSIVISYVGLRIAFRKTLPREFRPLKAAALRHPGAIVACGVVLSATLVGFFSEELTGVPTWQVAVASACVMLVLRGVILGTNYSKVFHSVGWDVLIFVAGIYVVAVGVRNVGLTERLARFLNSGPSDSALQMTTLTGLTAGTLSAVMNNHPTADTMAMAIRDMDQPAMQTRMLVYAAIIGGDLGPKMLPIGSLAALLWFRLLRDRGVEISYSLYVKLGVPITLSAILGAILVLNLELAISGFW